MKKTFAAEKDPSSEKLSGHFKRLIGNDSNFKKALTIAQRVASADLPVLIFGESGTGKEILARAIHQASQRRNQPLVDVNCAAIPDSLIESELFGYEKGAFTGARAEGRNGYFDEANKGTIFLDEIGDASIQTQSKLLRVLEEGCFKRVGGNRNIKVNVRVISATNKNLEKLITDRTFRDDLFYRLNTFAIHLPPLRERRGDIPLLVDYFLNESARQKRFGMRIAPEAMDILQDYHWPGNVRELRGVMSYATEMTTGSFISLDSLPNFLLVHKKGNKKPENTPPLLDDGPEKAPPPTLDQNDNLVAVVQRVEKELIMRVLTKSATRSDAIRALGISRRTFYMKLKQYDLA
ncbi:MAG TPA: sigma 54-interacting transcriptional regulator [Syntrophales bacterium]|nr:sigma 54-interacting transcriptional regulator [Syntrophales bacterium]